MRARGRQYLPGRPLDDDTLRGRASQGFPGRSGSWRCNVSRPVDNRSVRPLTPLVLMLSACSTPPPSAQTTLVVAQSGDPLAHRQIIKRYFERIHPDRVDPDTQLRDVLDVVKPADAKEPQP